MIKGLDEITAAEQRGAEAVVRDRPQLVVMIRSGREGQPAELQFVLDPAAQGHRQPDGGTDRADQSWSVAGQFGGLPDDAGQVGRLGPQPGVHLVAISQADRDRLRQDRLELGPPGRVGVEQQTGRPRGGEIAVHGPPGQPVPLGGGRTGLEMFPGVQPDQIVHPVAPGGRTVHELYVDQALELGLGRVGRRIGEGGGGRQGDVDALEQAEQPEGAPLVGVEVTVTGLEADPDGPVLGGQLIQPLGLVAEPVGQGP